MMNVNPNFVKLLEELAGFLDMAINDPDMTILYKDECMKRVRIAHALAARMKQELDHPCQFSWQCPEEGGES